MKIALLSIFIFVITSGKSQNLDNTDIVITSDFIDPVSLGKLNPTNQELYLTIESRYDECGEWGGHYEKTTVRSDSTGTIKAHYEKYSISCDSTYIYNRREEYNIKPIFTKTVNLSEQNIVALKKFSLQLLQASFSERNPGHSGKNFHLKFRNKFDINYTDYFSYQGFAETYEKFLESVGLK
tara:strand:+ start:4307 stop:4852 length:546 start_codon:yes stop_codon:yes gene_type:complete